MTEDVNLSSHPGACLETGCVGAAGGLSVAQGLT